MLPLTFVAARAAAIRFRDCGRWFAALAVRLLARRLDVPEVVVQAMLIYLQAYVGEVERNAAFVCPRRVLHDLRGNRLPYRLPASLQHGTGAKRSQA